MNNNLLKENIRKANSLINFFKFPKELLIKTSVQEKIEQLNEKIVAYLSEEYIEDYYNSHLKNILKTIFYTIKPIIPKSTQIILRKKYLYFQRKNQFPNWPIDLSLYNVYKKGIREIFELIGLTEIPFLNFWPNDKKFAVALTHGVETSIGQRNVLRVKEIEEELDFRSSWNFVPEKYKLDEELIQKLKNNGFEIGIHGLKHDGKLFKNKKVFFKRVSKINYYLNKYNCLGFASPSTLRDINYMQNLEIKYDTSFFDSDIFEPQAGGCFSLHPFFLGKFIELPFTMPQDYTLFILLGEKDENIWERKMNTIKAFNGMILLNTHPDYLIKKSFLNIYKEFLKKIKKERCYWHALPKEIAEWWDQRAKRNIKKIDGEWKIYPSLEGASIGKIRIKNGELNFS
ncbi:MAG: hypothetical protein ACTSRG_20990 [Candidatus Helarchaeota archaeon]